MCTFTNFYMLDSAGDSVDVLYVAFAPLAFTRWVVRGRGRGLTLPAHQADCFYDERLFATAEGDETSPVPPFPTLSS